MIVSHSLYNNSIFHRFYDVWYKKNNQRVSLILRNQRVSLILRTGYIEAKDCTDLFASLSFQIDRFMFFSLFFGFLAYIFFSGVFGKYISLRSRYWCLRLDLSMMERLVFECIFLCFFFAMMISLSVLPPFGFIFPFYSPFLSSLVSRYSYKS